jgi:hypothetical protein
VNQQLPRIAICGPGRSGKDTAGAWLAANTPLRLGRTTSEVIAPHVAKRLGRPVIEVFAERHQNRQLWFDIGNELRANDPAFLVRECLKNADIAVGLRNEDEVRAASGERIVDLVLWIEREVPHDPTMKFGPELCDFTLTNHGDLDDLYARLEALARFAGLLKGKAA